MGDQFCSLVFTLSNLYFTFCAYAHKFQPTVWETCGTQSQKGWLVAFVLAMLPLLARLIQSVRRYADSKLVTHLINGGKYGSGIIYYFFYYLWRHHGVTDRGGSFVLWCLFGAVYSIYACTWDFLMDWSFFKPRSRYPLLRPDLVYTNEIPFYYFTLVSNVLIRFIWVFYIPERGPSITLRTFIGGMLEMLRRWQWNFFRLENEHLGNMDQYRVTREVPLPYRFDETAHEEEDDADEEGITHKGWLRRQRVFSTNLMKVSGPADESHIG
ncbi:hypothetical protein PILCRDRAFT_193808 [Piloderma croceum F 1598]|uniref:EXS domain-containing protein n=1 Tax=Piloderma croceum (strain F 1598) TaxID=765440 RepID=A0A0C3GDA7_PILCF|nr:hypothetical protein PILCRDRAFT_193808 [Piloderma croceum F 1598]